MPAQYIFKTILMNGSDLLQILLACENFDPAP